MSPYFCRRPLYTFILVGCPAASTGFDIVWPVWPAGRHDSFQTMARSSFSSFILVIMGTSRTNGFKEWRENWMNLPKTFDSWMGTAYFQSWKQLGLCSIPSIYIDQYLSFKCCNNIVITTKECASAASTQVHCSVTAEWNGNTCSWVQPNYVLVAILWHSWDAFAEAQVSRFCGWTRRSLATLCAWVVLLVVEAWAQVMRDWIIALLVNICRQWVLVWSDTVCYMHFYARCGLTTSRLWLPNQPLGILELLPIISSRDFSLQAPS